jgi:uncharacterized protein (TIGR02757 family)
VALTRQAAEHLRPALEALRSGVDHAARLAADPVEIPHRYADPRDIEVSAFICASLAYGRVDLFKPKLEALHAAMGRSPAEFVQSLEVRSAARLFRPFVYRFNVGTDVAVLLMGVGQSLRRHGSLEALFVRELAEAEGSTEKALGRFTRAIRQAAPLEAIRKALGRERGLHHLLPAVGGGAAKRLNLFLRWMVRGPDAVDFGIWRAVSPAGLVIPLDTHIHRMARHLGLTGRKSAGWRTAEEITRSLALLDGADPVKYDFALCHFGMSGACPLRPARSVCARCPLLGACRTGRRLTR